MIDEVHTGSLEISELLGLLCYMFMPEGSKDINDYTGPRIILSSATYADEVVSDFFKNTPLFEIELPHFAVKEVYVPVSDDIAEKVASIIKSELALMREHKQPHHGLIFRPGLREVEDLISYLQDLFFHDEDLWILHVLNSTFPTQV